MQMFVFAVQHPLLLLPNTNNEQFSQTVLDRNCLNYSQPFVSDHAAQKNDRVVSRDQL